MSKDCLAGDVLQTVKNARNLIVKNAWGIRIVTWGDTFPFLNRIEGKESMSLCHIHRQRPLRGNDTVSSFLTHCDILRTRMRIDILTLWYHDIYLMSRCLYVMVL